jgi:hypothetical protein
MHNRSEQNCSKLCHTHCDIYIPYILESNSHPVFGDLLNGKKLVRDSNPQLSFNHPCPHGNWLNNIGCYSCVKIRRYA